MMLRQPIGRAAKTTTDLLIAAAIALAADACPPDAYGSDLVFRIQGDEATVGATLGVVVVLLLVGVGAVGARKLLRWWDRRDTARRAEIEFKPWGRIR